MKVSELTGALLDYWVARAEGYSSSEAVPEELCGTWYAGECSGGVKEWKPSTDWAQGGPIIERKHIDMIARGSVWDAGFRTSIESNGEDYDYIEWIDMEHKQTGATALTAAMRAYVASKFGDEVPDQVAQ